MEVWKYGRIPTNVGEQSLSTTDSTNSTDSTDSTVQRRKLGQICVRSKYFVYLLCSYSVLLTSHFSLLSLFSSLAQLGLPFKSHDMLSEAMMDTVQR